MDHFKAFKPLRGIPKTYLNYQLQAMLGRAPWSTELYPYGTVFLKAWPMHGAKKTQAKVGCFWYTNWPAFFQAIPQCSCCAVLRHKSKQKQKQGNTLGVFPVSAFSLPRTLNKFWFRSDHTTGSALLFSCYLLILPFSCSMVDQQVNSTYPSACLTPMVIPFAQFLWVSTVTAKAKKQDQTGEPLGLDLVNTALLQSSTALRGSGVELHARCKREVGKNNGCWICRLHCHLGNPTERWIENRVIKMNDESLLTVLKTSGRIN